jgi:hypothetical protein
MKRLCKQSKFIEQEKVAPIHPDYSLSNVGLMLLVDKMGSVKAKNIIKHLLITYHLGSNVTPFYSKIVDSGRRDEDDEIYSSFQKALKTLIWQIHPNNLIQF